VARGSEGGHHDPEGFYMSTSTRARYVGPSGTGEDITYSDPDTGEVIVVHVEQNALVPDGLPESVLASLLDRDGFDEAKSTTTSKGE
jgi:hypothetical protein